MTTPTTTKIPPTMIGCMRDYVDLPGVMAETVGDHHLDALRRGLRVRCPICGERGLITVPSDRLWHCFDCGEGGDVVSWVALAEDVDRLEAFSLLCARNGDA